MKIVAKIAKEHIEYFSQIIALTKTDLVKTYRGAALGWLWAIIKPMVTIFVYWFAFSIGLRMSSDVNGYPYFLWLLAGIIPWFYLSDMITTGASCMFKNSYLVTKMKFPVSIIPTFNNLSKLFVNLILVLITIVIFMVMGYMPTIYLLQLPIYIIFMFILMNAWSYFSSFISAMSKDFFNLVKASIAPVFWLSAILWNVDTIDIPWLKELLKLNPVTYIVNGFRNCFINQKWFFEDLYTTIAFVIILLIISLLGLWSYEKLRKEIPDII